MFRLLASLLVLADLGIAAQVGYFDSKSCVDPSGMESCYEDAESAWADCVNNNCEGQNIDCSNVCSCIRTQAEIDCAAAHCWDRVYGCEYQQTAGDIGTWCLNPDFSDIPFYPPPDDAPGACSCNLGKLTTSIYRTSQEIDSCGRNGEDILNTLTSNDEIQAFSASCICCAQSAQLSAFFDICPDTDPYDLGLQEVYDVVVGKNGEDDWSQCGDAMANLSCGRDGFDFTPPGGDSSAKFYGPDDFPAEGTQTISNKNGVVTAPVSGETFTWTYKNTEHEVTVASADAEPTADSEDDNGGGSSNNNDSSNDSNDNNGGGNDGGDSSQSGSGDSNGDGGDEDAAGLLSPSLWVLVACVLAARLLV